MTLSWFFCVLLGIEIEMPRQWGWAEWECHVVKLPSETMSSVAVGDGVRITVFPQDGLGLQTGWEQAASMYSALLWLDCALQLHELTACTLLTASHFVNSSMWGLKLVLRFTSLLMTMVLQKP